MSPPLPGVQYLLHLRSQSFFQKRLRTPCSGSSLKSSSNRRYLSSSKIRPPRTKGATYFRSESPTWPSSKQHNCSSTLFTSNHLWPTIVTFNAKPQLRNGQTFKRGPTQSTNLRPSFTYFGILFSFSLPQTLQTIPQQICTTNSTCQQS